MAFCYNLRTILRILRGQLCELFPFFKQACPIIPFGYLSSSFYETGFCYRKISYGWCLRLQKAKVCFVESIGHEQKSSACSHYSFPSVLSSWYVWESCWSLRSAWCLQSVKESAVWFPDVTFLFHWRKLS